MNKHKRNESCPCGSGHKYKKCCMAKDLEGKKIMDKPTNEFRQELEKERTNPEVMMLRDQIIMARAMECNHALADLRRKMLESTLIEVMSLQSFMQEQPMSPGMPDLTEAARVQVEAAKKALDHPDVSRADAVQLAALKAAIALADLNAAEKIAEEASEDIKAPIQDNGLPEENEEDTESEEEIEMVDPNEVPVKLES